MQSVTKIKEFSKEDILGILLSVKLDQLHFDVTTTSLSSVNPKKLPRVSLRAHYIKIGRCVLKIDLNHTFTSVTREREDMLRNILLAFLAFQEFTRKLRKCDLSDSQVNRLVSDISSRIKRKYMKMSQEELLSILGKSLDLNLRLYLAIPRISVLRCSPSVTDILRFLILDVSLFTVTYMERLEKLDTNLMLYVNDFVKSCMPLTTWQHVRVLSSVK